tara:strand:- start:3985 stop:4452 length:468 start_codon:yes stop_codon:yes gene_type:complete
MECIICYEDINNNMDDYIILECCNNEVHIVCLQKWLEKNINKNAELDKCFMCKNNNEFIKSLLPQSSHMDDPNYLSESSNDTIITVTISENDSENDIENQNTNENNNENNNIIITRYNNRHRKYIICNIIIFIFFMYIIFFILYNEIDLENKDKK